MARTLQSVDFDAVEMHMCFDQMQVLIAPVNDYAFNGCCFYNNSEVACLFFILFFGYATHAIRYAGVIIPLLLFNICYFMFVFLRS